jgi:hypothetical protein
MKPVLEKSAFSLLALAAAFVVGPAQAQPLPTVPAATAAETANREKEPPKGALFSVLSLAGSPLESEWSRLRPDAGAKFPGLELTATADLHVTIVYVGPDWKIEDLDRVRPLALIVPATTGRLSPEVVRMGRNDQVVAVELHGAPVAWSDSVVAAKRELNRLGLKNGDGYDSSFRPHVTLAEARHSPPTAADGVELAEFAKWISSKVAGAPEAFSVTVGPGSRLALWLAGATRPEGGGEYVSVETFLEKSKGTVPPS